MLTHLNLNCQMWQVVLILDSTGLQYNMYIIGPDGELVLGGTVQPCGC